MALCLGLNILSKRTVTVTVAMNITVVTITLASHMQHLNLENILANARFAVLSIKTIGEFHEAQKCSLAQTLA